MERIEVLRERGIATIWLKRPEVHNAFDEHVIVELTDALRALDADASVRAVVLADGPELDVTEFPQIAAQMDGYEVRIPPAPAPLARSETQGEPPPRIIQMPVRDPNALDLVTGSDMRKLDDLEREIITFALAHYRGHMSEVSRKLGIGRSTLYRKLKDYGLIESESNGDETDAA